MAQWTKNGSDAGRSTTSPVSMPTLRVFAAGAPSAIVDPQMSELQVLPIVEYGADTDAYVVALKPAGVTLEMFARHVRCSSDAHHVVPMTRMQSACSGLVVLAPITCARLAFSLRLVLLLGLRRIVGSTDSTPVPLSSFFTKYHMTV
eukprot:CAMPEP_0176420760 /NCGR_PEP_ID=MMETSP0127-20121128/8785_1 /TAXON_ID=938130 /ORGANISM="Platyophrya macrostoma, Strain WH" /LENGTH=146 /DNA_ID=CAMNT_0017801391 /DNA_START=225 /DNA_END=662 /DNA_ORIENTATION=-